MYKDNNVMILCFWNSNLHGVLDFAWEIILTTLFSILKIESIWNEFPPKVRLYIWLRRKIVINNQPSLHSSPIFYQGLLN